MFSIRSDLPVLLQRYSAHVVEREHADAVGNCRQYHVLHVQRWLSDERVRRAIIKSFFIIRVSIRRTSIQSIQTDRDSVTQIAI